MYLLSALHTIIYCIVCSALLFSFCPDLDFGEIENNLRYTEMSEQRYINKLTKSGNWIVGTIQGDPVKPNAENMARASLSAHIRSHVSQKLIQELNEVISSDKNKDFISERTETTLSVITDETIMGVNPISIKKDGMWWSIALKCKEEYSKERKDYNIEQFPIC